MDHSLSVALGDLNQIAYFRHLTVNAAGGTIEEDDRYLLFAGGHAYPGTYTNGAIRKSDSIGAAELLARADVFFGALGRQYILWSRAHADADLDAEARRRDLWCRPPVEGNSCILLTEPLPPRVVPVGFRIAVAESDADLSAYLALVARNWELVDVDEELAQDLLFSIASLRASNVVVLLAYDASGIVRAGISGFLAADCLGVEWGATDPVARGRGLASVLMEQACRWGFAHGARCVWGMASEQGTPLWVKLGFSVPTHYRRYLVTQHLTQAARQGSRSPIRRARPA
jgi:GNAT superfamily N-acetyltransferase